MMRKILSILLVTLVAVGVFYFGFAAQAQHVYLGMYWIAGEVSDPDGLGTEGRQIVFYKGPLVNNEVQGGYADDVVGTAGLSGRTDEYMLNGYEDYRLTLSAGEKYQVAIPNDNSENPAEGIGADPVEFTLSGKGYDIVPQKLVLMKGAGPVVSPRPTPGGPQFAEVRYGNRLYQPELVAKGQEFIVSEQPRVSAKIISETGLNTSQIFMVVNPNTAQAMSIGLNQASKVTASGPSAAPTELTFIYDFFNEGKKLADGANEINFSAANAYGTAVYDTTVTVVGGEARLIGVPITFPSPLYLKKDKEVIFQYTLSKDTNVNIFLFDVTGRVVKKFTNYARQEGGSAGVNQVKWNLITDQGQRVAAGIYVWSIVNSETGKLLGKSKATFLGQ